MKQKVKKQVDSKTNSLIVYIILFALGFFLGHLTIFPNMNHIQTTVTTTLIPLPNTQNFTASTNVLAVSSNDNTGVIGKVTVEIDPGKGRVLMDTNPFLEPDTQYSAETAVQVAENYTKMDLSDRDVIVSFNVSGQVLGGPSAGAAMTVTTIGAIEQKKIKPDIAITGTIEPAGNIGQIGGVIEKAQAAAKNGIKLFLIPKSELTLTYYERQVTRERVAPNFYIQRVSYVPKTLDVNNYTMSEWKMETKGVSTIDDAVKFMLE